MAQGTIYCITRLSNGQQYVGLTIKALDYRLQVHISVARKSRAPLARAIREDGRDGFSIEALEVCDQSDLPNRERYWIAKLGTVYPAGLNGNGGGAQPGPKGSGFADRARDLVKTRGVNLNTACRWVREGVDRDSARAYQTHGATGTMLWKRWHGLKRRGNKVAQPWHDFDRFVSDLGPEFSKEHRIIRRDRNLPWGPDNFALIIRGGYHR